MIRHPDKKGLFIKSDQITAIGTQMNRFKGRNAERTVSLRCFNKHLKLVDSNSWLSGRLIVIGKQGTRDCFLCCHCEMESYSYYAALILQSGKLTFNNVYNN